MNKRYAVLTASAAALVFAGVLFVFRDGPVESVPRTNAVATAPGASQSDTPASPAAMSAVSATPGITTETADAGTAATGAAPTYNPEQDNGEIAFRADASGHLVTDEKARLDLERLFALFIPTERDKKVKEVVATLPPDAGHKLYELMAQYQNYQAAVYQAYPPDREVTTVEQGVSQIDGMHGLRVQHFGEQVTKGMFGEEEKAQRKLYELMENEKDPGLSVEQKAEKAQRIYQQQEGR